VDIVLVCPLTPKRCGWCVEGEKGDGAIVDHDDFGRIVHRGFSNVSGGRSGRRGGARHPGERAEADTSQALGVTWSDRVEPQRWRHLGRRGIKDVMWCRNCTRGCLAQPAGRASDTRAPGLLFIDRDTATLSVVRSDDGSIVKVLSRSLHKHRRHGGLADMSRQWKRRTRRRRACSWVGRAATSRRSRRISPISSRCRSTLPRIGLALRAAPHSLRPAPRYDADTAAWPYHWTRMHDGR